MTGVNNLNRIEPNVTEKTQKRLTWLLKHLGVFGVAIGDADAILSFA